ncbi:RraA family protein [Emergencia sp.]|uniref:RraA family protein n=1 Tax=Emergencia sp. TaxID=1926557 RepID=UPI003AF01B40
MSNINCIVYNDFKRPDKLLIDRFRGIPVANLDDCMGRQAAADAAIKPIGKSGMAGPALTVKVTEGDNLMFHYAMDLAKEGDIIVIDAGGNTSRSIFGEIMVHYLLKKKVGGIIVDGAIRDKEEIAATGLPVYAKGVTPDGPWKNGPGTVNTPIVCGGRIVNPGDIVIADGDGVLFINPAEAEELLVKVKQLMENEKKSLDAVEKTGQLKRPWVMEKLTALHCEFHEFYEK